MDRLIIGAMSILAALGCLHLSIPGVWDIWDAGLALMCLTWAMCLVLELLTLGKGNRHG